MTRSYLAKHQPKRVWDDDEIKERARRAWVRDGILLIRPDTDLTNEWDRRYVIEIGNKLYGRRGNGTTRS